MRLRRRGPGAHEVGSGRNRSEPAADDGISRWAFGARGERCGNGDRCLRRQAPGAVSGAQKRSFLRGRPDHLVKGKILGWDVGGANIKVACLGDDHKSDPAVVEQPFPLWREPESLSAALAKIAGRVGDARDVSRMAVTMTAELADCFATKREGVAFVLDAFRTAFPGIEPWIYGGDGRFRSIEQARQQPLEVAADNWRASATLLARTCPDALFLDVGSTTTDIIPIVAGSVTVEGTTDPARL